jgi:hypothetical protein
MTVLLQKAFESLSALAESEQDAFANWILAELADEQHWDEQFASWLDVLEQLAEEARVEHRSGKARVLVPDELCDQELQPHADEIEH